MSQDNFIENAKRVKTERTKVMDLIAAATKRADSGPARDSEILLTLALNGYTLLPLSSGVNPKPEWVVITPTGDGFDPSFVVSADPKDL